MCNGQNWSNGVIFDHEAAGIIMTYIIELINANNTIESWCKINLGISFC